MEDWGSVGAWERVFDSPSRLLTSSLSSTISQPLDQIGSQSNLWSVFNGGQLFARLLAFSFSRFLPYQPIMKSEIRSPMTIVVTLVLARIQSGIIEASATRSPPMP